MTLITAAEELDELVHAPNSPSNLPISEMSPACHAHGRSLREISKELAARGYVNANGAPYAATSIRTSAMANNKYSPGPPMTLGNMRGLDVHHLIAYGHHDSCWHQALIDVSSYRTKIIVER